MNNKLLAALDLDAEKRIEDNFVGIDDVSWTTNEAKSIAFDGGMTDRERVVMLADCLDELVELMEATIDGEYKPDYFTCQPAKAALTKLYAQIGVVK